MVTISGIPAIVAPVISTIIISKSFLVITIPVKLVIISAMVIVASTVSISGNFSMLSLVICVPSGLMVVSVPSGLMVVRQVIKGFRHIGSSGGIIVGDGKGTGTSVYTIT